MSEKNKFKVGDKVVCINVGSVVGLTRGGLYTIKRVGVAYGACWLSFEEAPYLGEFLSSHFELYQEPDLEKEFRDSVYKVFELSEKLRYETKLTVFNKEDRHIITVNNLDEKLKTTEGLKEFLEENLPSKPAQSPLEKEVEELQNKLAELESEQKKLKERLTDLNIINFGYVGGNVK